MSGLSREMQNSLGLALMVGNLGDVARGRGDLTGAEAQYTLALEMSGRQAHDTVEEAWFLTSLGAVARAQNDLDKAEKHLRRAIEIQQRLAPKSLHVATGLDGLGKVLADAGDLEQAEECFRRALEIRERLAPGGNLEAETLHSLGIVLRRAGRIEEALATLSRAVAALETQIGRMGGTEEVRTSFRATYHEMYWDYLDLLLQQGRVNEAFHVLERSRARGLLAMLAERDLVFDADIPEELERERRLVTVGYERTQAMIAELSPTDSVQKVESLLATLAELRLRQEEIREEIRRTSPKLAALTYPAPLDVAAASAALDPGTVLVSYVVGPDKTHVLFLHWDGELLVETTPVGEEDLRDEVKRLRMLIDGVRLGVSTPDSLRDLGGRLYQLLLAPGNAMLAGSERLLLIPDGPLHLLPFAALVRPLGDGESAARPWQYLVEWRPIHSAVSATVYDQIRRLHENDPAPAKGTLVAFGDPRYQSHEDEGRVGQEHRSFHLAGQVLEALPATRGEVVIITGLYGENAQAFLGAEATEEQAKSLEGTVSLIHFATHGLLDPLRPLDSGLVLTTVDRPGEERENGLLQAWEVFEELRLGADLVTLSACRTALGREVAGEGIVGLTRAFQYAGARTVLASLWSVADESTAELMKRFYTGLNSGVSKDEALRQAQLELLQAPIELGEGDAAVARDLSHPFFWAAFQLYGDWKTGLVPRVTESTVFPDARNGGRPRQGLTTPNRTRQRVP